MCPEGGIIRMFQLRAILILSLCCVAFTSGGCSSTSQKAPKRFFWPALPDEPKIEHLGSYQSAADFIKESKVENFLDAVFGEEFSQVLFKPWGVASNGKGKIYVTDAGQAQIAVFDLNEKKISFISPIHGAYGITIDQMGRIYVASGVKRNITIFEKDHSLVTTFGIDIIKGPGGIAINDDLGLLYLADTQAHDIKVFNLIGDFLFAIGKRGDGKGEFNYPTDIDISSKGELVVVDSLNARIQILDNEGNFIRAFGRRGTGFGDFKVIKGIALDSEDHIYVTDALASHFKIFSMEGDLLLVVGGPYAAGDRGMAAGGFNLPMDIDIDDKDTIVVTDQQNFAFQVFQYMSEEYLRSHPVTLRKY